MSESQDHKMGAVLARLAILERTQERTEESINNRLGEMQEQLLSIQKTLAAASGSWRTLVAIGALISIISGALGAWFSHR